jgi:hypothetical protein
MFWKFRNETESRIIIQRPKRLFCQTGAEDPVGQDRTLAKPWLHHKSPSRITACWQPWMQGQTVGVVWRWTRSSEEEDSCDSTHRSVTWAMWAVAQAGTYIAIWAFVLEAAVSYVSPPIKSFPQRRDVMNSPVRSCRAGDVRTAKSANCSPLL